MITSYVDADSILWECGMATQSSTYTTPDEEVHSTLGEAKKWCVEKKLDATGIIVITEAEPKSHALKLAKNLLLRIKEQSGCDEMRVYLGGTGNFRIPIATIKPYKGNRAQPKPLHFEALKEYLVGKWGAELVDGMEAEDRVSIEATKDPENSVMVHIDKDVNNTAGMHYNWRSDRMYTVTDVEATHSFYNQVLMGDSTDNIGGVPGIGKVKAEKILHGITDELALYRACLKEYSKVFKAQATDALLENARLVWILRAELPVGQWNPPIVGEQVVSIT
jgi:hypothetical protein